MRTFITGDAQPVPGPAVLVRGGEGRLSDLRRAVARSRVFVGVPALSVYAGIDADTALRDARLVHRRVRVATAADVYRAGWHVYYTGDFPHASLVLPDGTDDTLARFVAVFPAVMTNPYVSSSSV